MKRIRMRHRLGFLVLAMSLSAVAFQGSKTRKSAAKDSLTGCVDQRDGQYVLTNDTNLQPIARLQPAAGSADDNFARHMGEKVTVKGRVEKGDPLDLITVQSVETVSQSCAPASGAP